MDRNLIALTNPLADSFIPNPDVFSAKVAEISKAGIGNVEVISDFDFTMTRYKVNDVKGCSTYTLLQNSVVKGNNAGSVQALIDFYHPIEIDPSIPTHIKQQHMQEWWEKSNKLILDDGFHKNELRSFVYASPMYFRHGVQELINTCRAQNVPITILSGGIGNLIEVSLSEIVNIDKIKIFSNFIEFDDQGRSLKFLEPEIRADKSKILNGISNRKNLILLGDLTSDIKMVDCLQYENCLKIGFYNTENYDFNAYTETFDLIIRNDGDLTEVYTMLLNMSEESKII